MNIKDELLKDACIQGGFWHRQISSMREYEWALITLVENGLLEAHGSKEWKDCHFSPTKAGYAEYERQKKS